MRAWLKRHRWALSGAILIFAYWLRVHPPSWGLIGYGGDSCSDLVRQLMAEQLDQNGGPRFVSDSVMTPTGASIPYMSWSIERDWLGAYAWKLWRDFPFQWAWFGVSLAASYVFVGFVLGKMGFSALAGWGWALIVVGFHVPRHFKIYHHAEHLPQHWIYLSLFLDAWIWHRAGREKKWDLRLELWRGVCLLGMLTSTGYFWGPLVMEWLLVRAGLLALAFSGNLRWERVSLWKRAYLPPVFVGIVLLVLELRWFLPLWTEAKHLGRLPAQLGWQAPLNFVFRPLAWEPFWKLLGVSEPGSLPPLDLPETVVAVGWVFWIPFLFGISAAFLRTGWKKVFLGVAPFLLLLGAELLYLKSGWAGFSHLVQRWVPFMEHFRVASRMGLFLPATLGVLVALLGPEIARGWSKVRGRSAWMGLASVIAALEVSWVIFYPINVMPAPDPSVVQLLSSVSESPGTTVLDMPFCVAGGNGICTAEQCLYPGAIVGQCFRQWHGKKVYGLYQARMLPEHCQVYGEQPFTAWFEAWRTQRCLDPLEWEDFCTYLEGHPELSAVLIYPDLWTAVNSPACHPELKRHLGNPLQEATFVSSSSRSPDVAPFHRVWRFEPRCLKHR